MRHLHVVLILMACLVLTVASPVNADSGPDLSSARDGSARQTPSGMQLGWELVWNDEFDAPGAPNPEYWSHEVNCWGGGNNEYQCYTDRLENSYVDHDGLLHIVAREERFSGPSLQDDDPAYPGPLVSRRYTSARLRTMNKVDWKYGRIEIRAQLPAGRGMWPALWMLPTDWVYGGWPSSGEIDIVEAVNLARPGFRGWGNFIHGTLHYGLPWPQWENHGQSYLMDVNPADGFHEYAIEWEENEIRWYVDGVHYQTQRSDGWYNYIWGGQETGFVIPTDTAPFDQLFHLLMNVAVGGDWPGPPDSRWNHDREMLVDYVRLYQCPGRGVRRLERTCGTIDPAVELNEDYGTPGIRDYVVYQDGFETLEFDVGVFGGQTVVENALVPGSSASPGVTVQSAPKPNGAWEIEFKQTGPLLGGDFRASVSLGSADMSGVAGVETGFVLDGGTGWTVNGEIEFDLKVLRIDRDARLLVGMEDGRGGRGLVEIDVPHSARWHHVAVKVEDILANRDPAHGPLRPGDIQNLFVLESTGPARVWVNNLHLQCAFNLEPEWWQLDKTCDLLPKTSSASSRSDFPDPVASRDRLSPQTGTTRPLDATTPLDETPPSLERRRTPTRRGVPPHRRVPGR